jgi:acetoacetyl-CoA synthetase
MSAQILWTPSADRIEGSQIKKFERWLHTEHQMQFEDYNDLWRWSVDDLSAFWQAIWDYFDLQASTPAETVLAQDSLPGAVWFPGARLNWAQHMLRHADVAPDELALVVSSETFGRSTLTWRALRDQVANVASRFRAMGVGQGDRVVAILPNTETALIACLAATSIGAIWSLCALDMGHVAILDRFKQIQPKILITQEAYLHAGKRVDRSDVNAMIADALPSVVQRISVTAGSDLPAGALDWQTLLWGDATAEYAQVPFDHPLWVVYSSGTTGNPKPIVHGHGGILLEGCKQSLHQDISANDRFCWLTSSGWVMWNAQFVALGQGARLILHDGAPNHPDLMSVWRYIAEERVTYFGVGAAYVTTCQKAGLAPTAELDLSALVSLGTTGSPLTDDGYAWVYEHVKADIWLAPISGGTDLCGAFVGGNVTLPVRAGEMQGRFLGNAVRAFDPEGQEIYDEVGELVCTRPLPSMPLFFWGDEDGSRLHDSYFDTYPGIWRHGDWIRIGSDGSSVIYGRSDATINRKGLRMGSSEIYRAVEALPEVLDSLVVDLEFLGRDSFMPLFVVPADGVPLDDALKQKINDAVRASLSARFIPNEIHAITDVPRTLSGKKLEVPVKKLLLGADPTKVVNRDSMSNPESFDFFVAYARDRMNC